MQSFDPSTRHTLVITLLVLLCAGVGECIKWELKGEPRDVFYNFTQIVESHGYPCKFNPTSSACCYG